MKHSIMHGFFVLLLAASALAQSPASRFFHDADRFLMEHVDEDGNVDYARIDKNPAPLQKLIELIARLDLRTLQEGNARKAFWLNTYNLLTIQGIIRHFPVASPKDIPGFFDRIKYRVSGKSLTLNDIENKIIRPRFQDPRIHFVLVCAAKSCPSLMPFAYVPDKLEAQIEERTRATLNDRKHVRINYRDKKILVSKIFDWYRDDFTAGGRDLITFINQYRIKKLPAAFKIGFLPYDWALNAASTTPSAVPEKKSNLQLYTPSTLLRRGQWEIKQFNNLYTQTAFYNTDGEKQELNFRSTYFTGIVYFLYGLDHYLNFGADFYFKSVRNDPPSHSPFSVLQFASGANARTALATIAPKLKVAPFRALPGLALQMAVLIPIASDLEGNTSGRPFLEYEDVQWWTQLFLDTRLHEDFYLYLENGYFIRFDESATALTTPLKIITNYFPSRRLTTYLQFEIAPTWNSLSWSNYYSQIGAGFKFLLLPNLEVESLYTIFPAGKNQGAGQAYNLGFRFLQ